VGRFVYALYAMLVITVMSRYSFQPPSPYRQSDANSYYHGSTGSRGSSSFGHK